MLKEKFIEISNEVHGNKYDYTKSNFIDRLSRITIICPEHGEFEQCPSQHAKGYGCPKCGIKSLFDDKETFIKKAIKIHGNKYDYSKVDYVGNKINIIVICQKHGEFKQRPRHHLLGYGCPTCLIEDNKNSKMKKFIDDSIKIHGNKYDYSKVDYNNSSSNVIIVCPEHGEFEQQPRIHIGGGGCNKCNLSKMTKSKAKFIDDSIKIHGNKYDYSKVNYINNKKHIVIICPIHGEFTQEPNSHLKGYGCKKCSNDKYKHSIKTFIDKSNKIHNNKYNYNKTDYKGDSQKIVVTCLKHGDFQQVANSHLQGHGCPFCANEEKKNNTKSFIEEATKIHNNKYDYSKVNYTGCLDKITIICPEHGEFEQRPRNHISYRNGCPICPTIISSPHKEIIDYIKSITNDQLIINDRKIINPFELDIFIKNKKLAIEINGSYWHSYNKLESFTEKNQHKNKTELCDKNDINLFQIWEHDWVNKNDLIKSMLKGKLNLNERIYARKCKIIELENNEYCEFLKENHLQGSLNCLIKYGLKHDGDLVSVIGFNKHKKYEWELSRFCSIKYKNIIGGVGKLLTHFIKIYNPKLIFSYANRSHSNGNMYEKLKFKLIGKTNPGYHYIKSGTVYSRQQFQKHKLYKKLKEFNPESSEPQNMFNNGYRRFWDSGNLKYLLTF